MTRKFRYLNYIGRCQGFHPGHEHNIRTGLDLADKVNILLGSANSPRTPRNPFTYDERVAMISDYIHHNMGVSVAARINFRPINDYTYNDKAWQTNVQRTVRGIVGTDDGVGLIGCSKDESNYYLKLFPQWGENPVNVPQVGNYNATAIRDAFFSSGQCIHVTGEIYHAMNKFMLTPHYKSLRDEYEYAKNYRAAWATSPYPPTFVTSDAIVTQGAHILLIKRKALPGKGLLAMPGGFINPAETLLQASVRELREETKLKVAEGLLIGSLKTQFTYDAPNRSERGRVITHAFHFDLPNNEELPAVKASSDAKKAFWLPIDQLSPLNMFEDHYFVICHMLGLTPGA